VKKLAVATALTLFAVVGYAADQAAKPEIAPPANGEEFLRLSSTEKLFWAIGYAQGYVDALDKIDVASGPNSACASLSARTEKQNWTAGKMTCFELVSGLEKFYADPANTLIPVGNAIRIYILRAAGKDQATLQELIETARTLGAENRRMKSANK